MLGDDCIWSENAPVRGMSFDDRMAQNAKKMMETVMEVLKEMCEKINKRDDVYDEFFLEIGLPEKREDVLAERENQRKTTEKKSWFGRLLSRKDHV